MVVGVPSRVAGLASRTAARVSTGSRHSTVESYDSMFRVVLAFCVFAGVDLFHLSPTFVLAFLEFLTLGKWSPSVILNKISAIKTKFSLLAFDISPFCDPRIKYFQKSLPLHRPFNVSLKSIIDPHTLPLIAQQCDHMFMGPVYKAAYILSFFSFLRISNLVSHTIDSYNPPQQLARADIILPPPPPPPPRANVIIKWSKTLQHHNSEVRMLKIPHLGSPHSALFKPLSTSSSSTLVPKTPTPLFRVQHQGEWVPLTDTRLHRKLSQILRKLPLSNSNITFHSLRCSGASLAFNSQVPLQDIQSHGTWTSECVWHYITHTGPQCISQGGLGLSSPTSRIATSTWGLGQTLHHFTYQ